METQMTDAHASADSGRNVAVGFILSCYLIGTFLWNAFMPADAYPARTLQMLTIGLNLLAVTGLFGVRPSVPTPLFWAALVAGLGLLALRLTSEHGWWTGHLFYSLPPR